MSGEIALLGQILTLASDEHVRIDEFSTVVASSPSLAAQVVKVANSALYGMEGKVTRLERAMLILGVRTVAAIASSVLVANETRGLRIGSISGDALWMHSLETGACAELLARCLSWPHESEAYLAGLLHDLGTQQLFEEHGDAYAALLEKAPAGDRPIVELEREQFGEDHGQRLERLATQWAFPSVLCAAFSHHHAPGAVSEPGQAVSALVHAAHILVEQPSEGWTDHAAHPEVDAAFLRGLGLSEDDIADVRATLEERLKDLAAAFAA